jgi:inosine-uridine nucleoside N-ribohydrolase
MNVPSTLAGAAALLALLLSVSSSRTEEPARMKVPILIDTDVGEDVDDALALALALAHPRFDVRGITTVADDAHTRALIVCRLLHEIGRDEVPVASAAPAREVPKYEGQFQYGLRPCFRKRPVKETAVEFLYGQLKANPGELTVVSLGPMTNIADLLNKHPDAKPWIKRLVVMAGSVRVGYNDKPPPEPEWNVKSDVKAAQAVFASGVPLVVAPLDATTSLKLEGEPLQRILTHRSALTNQIHALNQLWDKPVPVLFDPVAVALCLDERWFTMEELRLEVDDKGVTREVKGKANARVAVAVRREEFVKWYADQITQGEPGKPIPLKPTNPSAVVEQGGMPDRVHVIEDYGTDIERRWWLCGKLETENVPSAGTRACRGVLTNDFDDRMGDPKAVYTAVIFNPVPGPPMGKNTRLSFRYRLKGTGNLRVQIYSLTNGYHRHLTLTDLPQEKWQAATVDMTKARRPDGSGGPLGEDERIDDIQFYTDAGVDLLVTDIVLYDAAVPGEKRPFPRRPLFTAWFDTGRQGKEWPGTFEIVAKEKPLTWKAAKAVPNPDTGGAWVRLHLRGERPLGEATHLRFRYHLTGSDGIRVVLVNRTRKEDHIVELKDLKKGMWAETTADFMESKGPRPRKGDRVDEIHFLVPRGAELLVDDVLLYEPGT